MTDFISAALEEETVQKAHVDMIHNPHKDVIRSVIESINMDIDQLNDADKTATNDISDTCHTFGELYFHRMMLFATICNTPAYNAKAWKSKQHDDPNTPMFDGYFIVGIETPEGQATYHYQLEYWDIFKVKELERAPKYDGHTPADAIQRIFSLSN